MLVSRCRRRPLLRGGPTRGPLPPEALGDAAPLDGAGSRRIVSRQIDEHGERMSE